ncbi:MAG: flagellar protein FliT [Janthinobacterium lividum]
MDRAEMIALYENVAVLTGHMLEAARNSDWDRLVELESMCTRHVQTLRENVPPPQLAGQERDRKVDLINRILADDREIRRLTEPWMARLATLINSTGVERKLSKAYGSTPGA